MAPRIGPNTAVTNIEAETAYPQMLEACARLGRSAVTTRLK